MKLGISYEDAVKNIFSKEIFDVNFLDKFNIANVALDASVIFVTYNRCPYDPTSEKGSLNPLVWSVRSILKQKIKVKEIIIVDDCSTDYTKEVVDWFKQKTSEHNIVYIKNKKRTGSSESRNIGVKKASCNYVMFFDDDCLMAPYTCFGAVYSFEKMRKRGHKVGGVILPYYNRSTYPIQITGKKHIGVLDFANGEYYANWGAFPINYASLDDKYFIDKEMKILKPFRINSACGVGIFKRDAYLEVEGFPTHFTWKNKMGEETELAARLVENGYSIFFSPDPKFHSFHSRFGWEAKIKFKGKDWIKEISDLSFEEIVKDSEIKRRDTGNRVDADEYYKSIIIFFFVVCFKRNKIGSKKWIKKTYNRFVKENRPEFAGSTYAGSIDDEEKRRKIWYDAIKEGIEIIKDYQIQNRKDVAKYLEEVNQ